MNPVNRFGSVPSANPTHGAVLATKLGAWTFSLFPQLWADEQLKLLENVKWAKIKFGNLDKKALDQIPSGPGVYFFTVEGRIDLFQCHQYLFYAGKAERGLRSRFEDYLKERAGEEPETDRVKITEFLTYFFDRVYFNYSEFPKKEVAAIESAIKDNLTPPANTVLKLKGRLYK